MSGPTPITALTPASRRHLVELLEAPYWDPADAGEWATARALERRGYINRNPSRFGQAFKLTNLGRTVGEKVKAAA